MWYTPSRLRFFPQKTIGNPMQLTLGQAARQAKISKSYLSKLIRTGKISAERQPNGEFRIDPSELDRIPHIRSQKQPIERLETPQEQSATWERERELLLAVL